MPGLLLAFCSLLCAAPPPQSPAPSLQDLKNATYSGFTDVPDPVTLIDGRWESATARQTITFVGDVRTLGDLNEDGTADAVVLLAESTGTSGERVYLAVVTSIHGQWQNVATRALGPNVKLRRLRLVGRTIVLDVVQVGGDDAMCCPSALVTRAFVLNGTSLQEQPATQTGKLTTAAVGGTEWTLRRWSVTEAARGEPRVTLRYHDGQVTGSAGCNRYMAPVKSGEQPGAIEVGSPASSHMACPDDVMGVEARFLRQLRSTTNFAFAGGQLALTYTIDGQIGTMFFGTSSPGR
jgi:heat shock protein HslJ